MKTFNQLGARTLVRICAFLCITASSALFADEHDKTNPIQSQKINRPFPPRAASDIALKSFDIQAILC